MKEPNWDKIAEYTEQRADTLFGDAETVDDSRLYGDIIALAYTYQELANKAKAIMRLQNRLDTGTYTGSR